MKSPVVKRSIVIAGHKTSVSLEDAFWTSTQGNRHRPADNLVGSRRRDRLRAPARQSVLGDKAVRPRPLPGRGPTMTPMRPAPREIMLVPPDGVSSASRIANRAASERGRRALWCVGDPAASSLQLLLRAVCVRSLHRDSRDGAMTGTAQMDRRHGAGALRLQALEGTRPRAPLRPASHGPSFPAPFPSGRSGSLAIPDERRDPSLVAPVGFDQFQTPGLQFGSAKR